MQSVKHYMACKIHNAAMLGAGYLGSAIMGAIPRNWHIAKSIDDIRALNSTYKISEIWHFASPTDDFESNFDKLIDTVQLTKACAEIANKHNIKLIYASSYAAMHVDSSWGLEKLYAALKVVNEFIVQQCNNFAILQIPRVYSFSKNTGIVGKLKSGNLKGVEPLEIRDFMTLDDFANAITTIADEGDLEGIIKLMPTKSCSNAKLLEFLKNSEVHESENF